MVTRASESEYLSLEEASVRDNFAKIIEWIETFLCAPNADLGRAGDVCPFARTTMSKRSIEFFDNRSENVMSLLADVETHMEDFLGSGATQDIYRCRIIVPSRLHEAASAVEFVQKTLKPAFVQRHLMIGQFFQNCEEPGLWNNAFRPLQAPVPLIAIRNMVPTDVAFLYSEESYLRVYLEKFGSRGTAALRQIQRAMETEK